MTNSRLEGVCSDLGLNIKSVEAEAEYWKQVFSMDLDPPENSDDWPEGIYYWLAL